MRPTISLCVIAKNEENNIQELYNSIVGCFDELILVDTGSTDKTVEIATKLGFKVFDFEWIQDFSAARNFSFSKATCDYIMWLDLDDSLNNKEAFINFRDNLMGSAEFWLNPYEYASDHKGNVVCTFARERVVKNHQGYKWVSPCHEGIISIKTDGTSATTNYATGWTVRHRRTADDLAADKGRNQAIIEKWLEKNPKDVRMQYYYGKELFENGNAEKALTELVNASAEPNLEYHDRVLAIQYATMAAMKLEKHDVAIKLAQTGLHLSPQRAEFFVSIGDCYSKTGKYRDALPYYYAATKCKDPEDFGGGRVGALFSQKDLYTHYPKNQMARVYAHLGDTKEALNILQGELNDEGKAILSEVKRLDEASKIVEVGAATKVNEIVISCPPQGLYEWDEELEKTKGFGGSETAAIRLARQLHELTGMKVRIFNNRTVRKDFGGVIYHPAGEILGYMRDFEPKVHIAWRHNIKVTHAPTYLWCHDLYCMGIDNHQNYDAVLALSEFHKKFILASFPMIPKEKILVFRNGIDSEQFYDSDKNINKLVYTSSPDRGLDKAILVVEEARKTLPNLELHCGYSFDNMIKMGKTQEVERMTKMINDRGWVTMHGNLNRKDLTALLSDAVVWIYPTDFSETFCCTALEMICSKVYPIVHSFGALTNTLGEYSKKDMAKLLDFACDNDKNLTKYANEIVSAIKDKKWEAIKPNKDAMTWESVTKDFMTFADIKYQK